jgi:hypothetical protein
MNGSNKRLSPRPYGRGLLSLSRFLAALGMTILITLPAAGTTVSGTIKKPDGTLGWRGLRTEGAKTGHW